MKVSKRIGFFALQLLTSFIFLSAIIYLFPRDFWLHALVGFFVFLFLNVFFDLILKTFFKIDTSIQGNGYSKIRNRMISSNYFLIAALLFLSGMGSLVSQKSINDVVLLGIPLLV